MVNGILILILWSILIPIITGGAVLGGGHNFKWRNLFTVFSSLSVFAATGVLYLLLQGSGRVYFFSLSGLIPLSLQADELSIMPAVLISFFWLVVTVYSLEFMSNCGAGQFYYPVLNITLGATMGIIFSGDLFSFFIYFQVLAMVSYLAVINRQTAGSYQTGLRYLGLSLLSGVTFLTAVLVLYSYTGTMHFVDFAVLQEVNQWAVPLFVIMLGFLVSLVLMSLAHSFYIWYTDAYPLASSPFSVLLFTAMLVITAYGLLRLFISFAGVEIIRLFSFNYVLLSVALLLLVTGALLTLKDKKIKGRLTSSTLVQLGYILILLTLIVYNDKLRISYQLFSFIFIIGILFLSAATLTWRTGKQSMEELSYVGWQVPVTLITYTNAAALSVIIPLQKAVVILLGEGYDTILFSSGLGLVAVLNALFYLPIPFFAFKARRHDRHLLHPPPKKGNVIVLPSLGNAAHENGKSYIYTMEAPGRMFFSMVVLTMLSIILTLYIFIDV